MSNVFKSIGRGVLYFFLLPLILLATAIYAVYGIGVFLFELVRVIYLFFTGRTLNSDLPEDIQVKSLVNVQKEEEPKQDLSYVVYNGSYSSPIEEEPKEDEIIDNREEENL